MSVSTPGASSSSTITVLSPTTTSSMNVATTPAASEKAKKRKSIAAPAADVTAKKKSKASAAEEGKYCHHCHRQRESTVSCTLKLTTKKGKTERCGKTFCDACLSRVYGATVASIVGEGKIKDITKALGHDSTEAYYFRCPICDKKCQCAQHREKKKEGEKKAVGGGSQSSAADLERFAKEAGVPVSEVAGLMNDSSTRNKGKLKADVKKAAPAAEKGTEKKPAKKKAAPKKGPSDTKTAADKQRTIKPTKSTGVAPSSTGGALGLLPAAGPLQPMMVKKPKHVDAPNFEFIVLSYPPNIIRERLRVREFVLRFEKKLNLVSKYPRIINYPNSDWTELTYKNLITSMLRIMQSDKAPPAGLHPDDIFDTYKDVQHCPSDSSAWWISTCDLVAKARGKMPEMEDIHKNEEHKLELVVSLIQLTLTTAAFREAIDAGLAKQKQNHVQYLDEVKRLKEEWEQQRQVFQKERLVLPSAEKADLEARFSAAQMAHKQLMLQAERKEWRDNQKLSLRTLPLGVDTLGNTYHLFIQRDWKDDEDWGRWIVIEKNPALPHPSGVLPPPPSVPSDSGMDPDMPDLPVPDDEETVRARIWYLVSETADIQQLADWIRFKGEMALYEQELAKVQSPPTPGPSVPASPSPNAAASPMRQVMEAVSVPVRKKDYYPLARTPVTKEGFMPLVDKLKKLASYFALGTVV